MTITEIQAYADRFTGIYNKQLPAERWFTGWP